MELQCRELQRRLPWAVGPGLLRARCINRNLILYSACLSSEDIYFLGLGSFTVKELKILFFSLHVSDFGSCHGIVP